jgi:hypothetical protein
MTPKLDMAFRGSMYVCFAGFVFSSILVYLAPNPADAAVRASESRSRIEAADTGSVRCLAQTFWGEARGVKSDAEVRALMRVALKRASKGRSICGVVKASAGGLHAFLVWDKSGPNYAPMVAPRTRKSPAYKRMVRLAREVLSRGKRGRWTHYIHPDVMVALHGRARPTWWRKCVETQMIGRALMCRM